MEKRDVERALNAYKYGLSIWNKSYYALVNSGFIVEEGRGVKGDPRMVRLLRTMNRDLND